MRDPRLHAHVVVNCRCRPFWWFPSSLCRGPQKYLLNSVLHVQHDYLWSFNQWYHCFVALLLLLPPLFLRARLHGEFHPGLKFQTGFWNKSSENQVVDYMERDSARGAIQPGLKILAQYSQTGLGFSARPNRLKNPCNRYHFFSPGWKSSASMRIYCVSHLSKLSHGN